MLGGLKISNAIQSYTLYYIMRYMEKAAICKNFAFQVFNGQMIYPTVHCMELWDLSPVLLFL